jgi:flagellar basal body-associated protein FliL
MKALLAKILLYGGPGLGVVGLFVILHGMFGPQPPSSEEVEQSVAERRFMQPANLAEMTADNASETADNATAEDAGTILPTSWHYYSFIETLTSNMADTGAFLKLEVSLAANIDALAAEGFIADMDDMAPAMRSAILLHLGGVTREQAASREGRELLAEELLAEVNKTLEKFESDSRVDAVYLTDLAVIN